MKRRSPKEPQSSDNAPSDQLSGDDLNEMLGKLSNYSKATWTEREERLWKQYVNLCRDSELEELASRDKDPKVAKTLVRTTWVMRCSNSGRLVEKPMPPEAPLIAVPFISVFRNGKFEIEDSMRFYLEKHPLLSRSVDEISNKDDEVRVLRALADVLELEEELGVGRFGLHHLNSGLTGYTGEENRLGHLGTAAYWLRLLLDDEYRPNESKKNLQWLVTAKSRDRFWRLLDAAMCLGEAVERRRILDDANVEVALKKSVTSPRGKHSGEVGTAMGEIIGAYILDKGSAPTANQLCRWLGAERPPSDGDPLRVKHPLWTDVLEKICWITFKRHVNDANKRKNGINRTEG